MAIARQLNSTVIKVNRNWILLGTESIKSIQMISHLQTKHTNPKIFGDFVGLDKMGLNHVYIK